MLALNLGLEIVAIHPNSGRFLGCPEENDRRFVIAGLDPAIHLLRKRASCEEDGYAGQARV
jgi:hypothetical protein